MANAKNILIVDDETDIRLLIQGILEDEGYKTRLAANARDAYAQCADKLPDLVILDIWLQGSEHDGLEILENLKKKAPNLPILMISGHGTIKTAVSAIQKGAYDFIEKPFKSDRLLLMVDRALENAALRRENERLRRKVAPETDMIGNSVVMQTLRKVLDRVAPTNSRVLLTGQPGTGKDIVARYIHKNSLRADGPFMVLNCATLMSDRLEIELLGTTENYDADAARVGVLEQAHGGTLFLDEVADMPMETQGKIVRILQEQKFQRLGAKETTEVDVRIIASTNRDLQKAIADGEFREDFYYRLNVVPIELSPLNERVDDIPDLVDYFAKSLSQQSGMPIRSFAPSTLNVLKLYEWPGNLRQLRNVVEWAMIMKAAQDDQDTIMPEDLPPELANSSVVSISAPKKSVTGTLFIEMPLRDARESFERDYLMSQINRFAGNISKTAQFVGMERSALHRKLKSLNIGTHGDKVQEEDATSELKAVHKTKAG